jgi:cysteine desulfurase/selenocysteine lyase
VERVALQPNNLNQQFMEKESSQVEETVLKRSTQGLDIDKIRDDFPMLKTQVNGMPLIYFDSAATNHKPQVVIDHLMDLYTRKYGKTQEKHTFSEKMTAAFEETRYKFAELIHAGSPEQIVFTTGSTQGINMVANGFARTFLKEDDEILISALEHHSNIVPWQMACQQTGARLVVVPIHSNGELDMEEYKRLLTSRTKIVSVCHSSNVLGTMIPAKELIRLAHGKGIPVLIDGAQTAPHMKIDVQDLDCDFYVFSVHKMGGPAGVGILYGKSSWLDQLPPQLGGEGMASEVTFEQSTYQPIPKKFEAGTPAFEEIVSCAALVDYVNALDMSKAEAYELELMAYATEKLNQINKLKIYGTAPEKEPVISFVIEGMDVKELEKYLSDKYNIAVKAGQLSAQPLLKCLGLESLLRVALCYYNTYEEIDVLVTAIQSFIEEKEKA